MLALNDIPFKTVITSASAVGGKLLGLATLIVITSVVSSENYGQFILFLSYAGFSGSFYNAFFGSLFSSELASYSKKSKKSFMAFLKKSLILFGFLSCIIFVALAAIYYFFSFIPSKEVLLVLVFIAIFSGLKQLSISCFQALGNFEKIALYALLETVMRLCAVLCFVLEFFGEKHTLSIVNLLYVEAVVQIIMTFVAYFALVKTVTQYQFIDNRHFTTSSLLNLYKHHGKWHILKTIVLNFESNVKVWIIASILSLEAVAIYNIAKRIVQAFKVFLPIGPILTTYFSYENCKDKKDTDFKRLIGNVNVISIMISCVAIMMCFILKPLFFSQYPTTLLWVSSLMCILLVFKGGTYVLNAYLVSNKSQKILFLGSLAALIYTIVIFTLFINYVGIYGAAIAPTIGALIIILFRAFMLNRLPDSSLKVSDLFLLKCNDLKTIMLYIIKKINHKTPPKG